MKKSPMWLKYGVDASCALISIADVPSGKTNLACPYCGSLLIAKKGSIKEHHFAHQGETCRLVNVKREFPTLPLYDRFNINLSGQAFQLLKELWQSCGQNQWDIPFSQELKPLIKAKLLRKNYALTPPAYEFTQLGLIPVGALPLDEFNQIQERILLDRLSQLQNKVEFAQKIGSSKLLEQTIDLQLYRAQLRSILAHRLYYLEIRADGKTLHKIGITQRTVEERMVEVEGDLRRHYKRVELKALGSWSHRGNVELYFKHKYKSFNHPISSLTEYYKFDEPEAVLHDLSNMKPKELSVAEEAILATPYIYCNLSSGLG